MPRYIIERNMKPESPEQLCDSVWVRSYGPKRKARCEYEAPDTDAIHEAGEAPQADAFAAAALAVGREIGDKSLVTLASELQSPDSKSSTD